MRVKSEVDKLLDEFELINSELASLIHLIRQMVLEIAPESKEKKMYGGIIYSTPGRMFCGLFIRKNHVSVEFDLGYLLDDKEEHLEGSGKFRRHLKIHNEKEVKSKRVRQFIIESFRLKS